MRPVAMIEEGPRVTVRQFMRPYPAIMGVPLHFGARDLRILGDKQVEAVTYKDARGIPQTIETDGVIISGRFRPEAALLHASHLEIDPATGGPSIDQYGRASDPTYFCTGNLLRPVETSSWCWHEAVEAAPRIVHDLKNPVVETTSTPLVTAGGALRFVVPQRLVQSDAPHAMGMMQLRLNRPAIGHLIARTGGKTLWSDFLQSRPERRILAPLAPVLKSGITAPVEMEILEGN